jgi:putative membrane protein
MIVYKSNQHFFGDILHLGRSYTMVKILRGVLAIGAFSAVVCFVIIHFGWQRFVNIDRAIFSFLGIVLSILLVFRTNSAYDRWWEGRIQWGALVNHCRNLAIQLHATIPAENTEARVWFGYRIANFCIAFKEHLRDGTKLDELLKLSPADRAMYEKMDHVPNCISYEIQSKVETLYRADAITGYNLLNIKTHTQALLDILGACERIKKTPIPFSYAIFIKIFILAYGVLLPFSLVGELGYYAIPITMFVFFAFLGVELMAEEIEDPFGIDCNDLPTGTIAKAITDNIFEILQIPSSHTPKEQELYSKIF